MEYENMEIDEDDTPTYGNTPGDGNFVTADGNEVYDDEEIPVERKLELAEKANEIYIDQIRQLQEHVAAMRGLLQNKECIIANLVLRFDLGLLPQDNSREMEIISMDKMEEKELRRKAEALAQRTILENFELRELVNEQRDENFQLRNEIFDLEDRLSRQALVINKLTKMEFMHSQMHQTAGQSTFGDPLMANGVVSDGAAEEAQQKHEERAKKHNRKQSSIGAPRDFWENNQNENDEDQNQDDEITPNKENGQPEATPEIQAQENDEEQRQSENDYMDEAALKKRKERQDKSHEKKGTLVTPEEFLDKPDVSDGNENDDKLNKRRGSQHLDEETQANIKSHQSADSQAAAIPDYANTEEAKRIREERAKKARKESVAVPKNFLSTEDQNSEDDESVQKRRQHQRKQSLMKAVGQKGHLSDEDTEKTQHVDHEARRKDKNARPKTKDAESTEHRRQSSLRALTQTLEDPAVLLTTVQQEVKNLKERLTTIEEEKRLIETQKKMIEEQKKLAEEQTKLVEGQKRVVEEQLQNTKKEAQQLEHKLGQQLEKQIEEKFQKTTNGLIASNKKEVEQMTFRIDELTKQLNNVSNSKMNLIQCTNTEITRLNRVINTLLQSEKCKEITRLLLDNTTKE